jgi:ABC-type transporter Mla subunit MlaD
MTLPTRREVEGLRNIVESSTFGPETVVAVAELIAERDRLRRALDELVVVTAGLARRSTDMIDQIIAAGAIASANAALARNEAEA